MADHEPLPVSGPSRLARRLLLLGLVGIPLWLLSFIWVPFEVTDTDEPGFLFPLIVAGEGGALVVGITGLIAGLRARKQATNEFERKTASRGAALSGAIVFLLVGFGSRLTF